MKNFKTENDIDKNVSKIEESQIEPKDEKSNSDSTIDNGKITLKQKPKAPRMPKVPKSKPQSDGNKSETIGNENVFLIKPAKKNDIKFNMYLNIHTNQALSLVVGGNIFTTQDPRLAKLIVDGKQVSENKNYKRSKFSSNLFHFGRDSNRVVTACENGNPFAIKILCDFEDKLNVLFDDLSKTNDLFSDMIKQHEESFGIVIKPVTMKEPTEIGISFKSFYANEAAKFIGAFDIFMKKALSLRRAKVLGYEEWRNYVAQLNSSYKSLIKDFYRFDRYFNIDIEKYHEHFNNPKKDVAAAIARFGMLDDCYLDGSKKPENASIKVVGEKSNSETKNPTDNVEAKDE